MSLAFYAKDGTLEYYNDLGNAGNPGFFEDVGAGSFTFDPKCFYDHDAGRFVVLALEVYGDSEAYITFAVSDDSDPNGIWYKYRTDAVILVGSTTYWWDYPGLGYDDQGYYVTGNLFGLNQGGWGGVGFRVIDKASVLSGGTAQYATLRDGGSATVQVVQHFGSNQAPYFVSVASGSSLRVHAITDPLTNPQLVSTLVAIPTYSGPVTPPSAGGNTVGIVGGGILNAQWRGGRLYAAHQASADGVGVARWYEMQTNDWPNSGDITLTQSGEVHPLGGGIGREIHAWFPAIYANADGSVGLVIGTSSVDQRIAVEVAGRAPDDPLGYMGAPTMAKLANVDGGGRWGDYYDIAVDPADDRTFWVIGEYPETFGWATWIGSFTVDATSGPKAVDDHVGVVISDSPMTIDVMGNDFTTSGSPFDILAFDDVTVQGGTVTLSEGTGPGGRDELTYTPPTTYTGPDSFTYIIMDDDNKLSNAAVYTDVYDAAAFRDPENPDYTHDGLEVAWYELSAPTSLPDFSALTPYATDITEDIDFYPHGGLFGSSGRQDELGAVFDGYILIPETNVYTLLIESDDGSKLYLGPDLLIDNDGTHGMTTRSETIGLKAGLHAVRVEFFEDTGTAGLNVRIAGGNLDEQVVPPSMWKRANPCPPDINEDGSVNSVDFIIFLTLFNDLDPQVDFNNDGIVNSQDFVAFLNLFVAGC
jgi:hypothetical protein